MSCYFSPPVYARNWANGQNLVDDSTKIERLQVVSSKKQQRKEKKERKKDKKLKSEKSLKLKFVQSKQVCDETEQIEKSCVTEEVEQQQSVGYLSDGSQNSKKRRRENSPAVESQVKATPVAAKPLKIKFVFKKPKAAEFVLQEDHPVCSTSASELRPCEVVNPVLPPKTCDRNESLPSTSYESEKALIPCESKKTKKHKPSKESRFNTLFDEWVPPCISSFAAGLKVEDSNNDDWLFGSSRQGKATYVRNDQDLTMSLKRSGDSSFPSRAQLLPEVGIFSLPYTVLF